jgi:hypothetical protein
VRRPAAEHGSEEAPWLGSGDFFERIDVDSRESHAVAVLKARPMKVLTGGIQ